MFILGPEAVVNELNDTFAFYNCTEVCFSFDSFYHDQCDPMTQSKFIKQ